MIKCSECGEQAPDDAKFCDRCGQALTAAPPAPAAPGSTRPDPVPAGARLNNRFEILEALVSNSLENRYRARRLDDSGATVLLRERIGPEPREQIEDAEAPAEPQSVPEVDPNGPSAKTAELKPIPAASGHTGSISAIAAKEVAEQVETIVASPAPSGGRESKPEAAEASAAARSNGTSAKETVAEPAETEGLANDLAEKLSETRADEKNENGSTQAHSAESAEPESDREQARGDKSASDDLGEVFGRVMALSLTLSHPAFQRAETGFAADGRVYLVYPDEELSQFAGAARSLSEPEAIAAAIQVCQAISFMHRRGLRVNDICPQSVAVAPNGRIKMTGLDYVSNDNELQAEPIFNDGYTAPEIYRGRKVDKRADIFSAGALLYTWLTGDRLESESWREEAGPIRFYPPHVITPELEQAILRALQFDPKSRWATIDEFKAELIRLMGQLRIRAVGMTDVGMVRDHNEDAVMVLEYVRDSLVAPDQNYVYVVCDGMGGAEAGEVAAAIAISTIRDYVEKRLAGGEVADPCKLMSAALEEANSKILEHVAAHPESRGMGSTGVAALVTPPGVAVAWVGDSRAYFVENGSMHQVTRDHSLVQRLVEIGQITAAEARTHEHKNVITRSLGARASGPAGAEATSIRLRRGDRLLLCSDGLTTHVEDVEVAAIMRRHNDPYDTARELIAAANAGGGTDNISVVVMFAS